MHHLARFASAPAFATLLVMLCATGVARADGDPTTDDVPRMLPYQGRLEVDGAPVDAVGDAALHLLFALYDGPDAEQPVYSQPLVVEVYAGRFTATIGPEGVGPDGEVVPVDAIIAAADDLHLGMTLLGDPNDPEDDIPLANRQRIYATPYAMWSTTATDLAVAGQARVGGDVSVGGGVQVDGGLRIDGPVDLPGGSIGGAEVADGSLRLDDFDPAMLGEGLERRGASIAIDEDWLQGRIRSWVRSNCHARLGWRDNCGNCDNGPEKNVTVRADGTCTGASGSDTRCRANNTWGGVNTDGDVDGNDVFYIRLICN